VTDPTRPVDDDVEITPFLYSALSQDLEISDPGDRPAIKARAAAIRTRADAAEYMKNVATRVTAAKRSRPPRSARVQQPALTAVHMSASDEDQEGDYEQRCKHHCGDEKSIRSRSLTRADFESSTPSTQSGRARHQTGG
jgi:hypothetical protein